VRLRTLAIDRGSDQINLVIALSPQREQSPKLSLLLRNVTDGTCIERPHTAHLHGHFVDAPQSMLLRANDGFK
jgi:hypothetical protein